MSQSQADNQESGFGVIESIIFLLMVFILAIVVLAAYSGASKTQRDAQRVSDVVGLQKALGYFYQEFGTYPQASDSGQAVGVDNSFARFVPRWPVPPTPADGVCTNETNAYIYEQLSGGDSYHIRFCLGDNYGNARAGVRTVNPTGVQ